MNTRPFSLRRPLLFSLTLLLTAPHLFAVSPIVEQAVMKNLSGAREVAHLQKFSRAISDVYLAFDARGKVTRGIALRRFKTYETVTAMLILEHNEKGFVAIKAEIPDISIIKKAKKRTKVLRAINAFAGKVIQKKNGPLYRVDAVSGATRYQKRIYATLNLLAKKLVAVMQNPPANAPRFPAPQQEK